MTQPDDNRFTRGDMLFIIEETRKMKGVSETELAALIEHRFGPGATLESLTDKQVDAMFSQMNDLAVAMCDADAIGEIQQGRA